MGSHLIIDFSDIPFNVLDDMDGLYSIMESINKACNIHVLGHLKHKFEPQGCSIIFLLAESHFSAHLFPELGKGHFDLYHCGPIDKVHKTLEIAANMLVENLGGKYKIGIIDRG
jgi:S-adenosylmethionine decarboxylase proenzyme